jgi:hypothetical protein
MDSSSYYDNMEKLQIMMLKVVLVLIVCIVTLETEAQTTSEGMWIRFYIYLLTNIAL